MLLLLLLLLCAAAVIIAVALLRLKLLVNDTPHESIVQLC